MRYAYRHSCEPAEQESDRYHRFRNPRPAAAQPPAADDRNEAVYTGLHRPLRRSLGAAIGSAGYRAGAGVRHGCRLLPRAVSADRWLGIPIRSEEPTSELQALMRSSYAV